MVNGVKGVLVTADFAQRMLAGIAESRSTTVLSGGANLLRMMKSGEWVFGMENLEVQEGSLWALNIMTIMHGWCCWTENSGNTKNTMAGEVMVSMLDHKPPMPPPVDGFPYKDQRSFELRCMNGEDEGTQVLHKILSIGGIRACDGLLAEIQKQLRKDHTRPCPVLALGHDHYDHPKWGRIYTPVYQVVDWCDLDGNTASAAGQGIAETFDAGQAAGQPQPPPAKPAPPPPPARPAPTPEPTRAAVKRPRRAAVAGVADAPAPGRPSVYPVDPVLQAKAAPEPPVATAQLHTGQRRRPVAR
jgi:hypothetical protein